MLFAIAISNLTVIMICIVKQTQGGGGTQYDWMYGDD